MKTVFVFLFLFVLNNYVTAQVGSRQLMLIVLNQDSAKIEGATVKINQSGKDLSALTGKDGAVTFSIENGVPFAIEISHVGFETVIKKYDSLFSQKVVRVVLLPQSKELKEIKITGEKPFISIDKNKIVISIDKNKVAGQSVVDILKKAPGITLQNNIIFFEGKPVSAQMKGKRIPLSVSDLTGFLAATSASAIEEIEIVTVPLSNTDASVTGALVNLKPVKILNNGFSSSLNFEIGTRSQFGNGGLGGWLNFKYNKLTGFIFLGDSKDFQNTRTDIHRRYTPETDNKTAYVSEISKGIYKPENVPLAVSLEYAINKRSQAGAIINGMLSHSTTEQNSTSSIFVNDPPVNPADSFTDMHSLAGKKTRSGSVDLFYKLKPDSAGQQLNFDVAYSKIHSRDEDKQQYDYYLDDGSSYQLPSSLEQASVLDIISKSIQVDYVKPIRKIKLEAGLKQSWTSADQSLNQTIKSQRNPSHLYENLTYKENISAGYLTLSGTLASIAYSIGARGENTAIKSFPVDAYSSLNKTYFELFPTLLLSGKIGTSSLVFSYRKSIARPRFNRLTNFKNYISPFYYFTGNPALQPYFQNTLRLSWAIKNKFQVTGSYTWYKNNMLEFAELDTVNNITKGLIANNGNFKSIALYPNYSANITKWWYTNTGLGISQRHLTFSSNQQPVTINNMNFSINTSNTFTLSKSMKCEIYAYYSSATFYSAARTGDYWFTDFSFYKNVFKGSGQISLSVNDIFYSNISKTNQKYALVSYDSRNRWDSRNIILGFNYTFGSKNYKFRQLRRNSATDDVRSRSN